MIMLIVQLEKCIARTLGTGGAGDRDCWPNSYYDLILVILVFPKTLRLLKGCFSIN